MIDHKIKYIVLILPAFILSVILLYTLPQSRSLLAMSPMFIGWVVYYLWKYLEKKSAEDVNEEIVP